MRRTILSVTSLAVAGFWLYFTYGPSDWLPQFRYPAWLLPVLTGVALLGLAAMTAVQVWVTWSTDQALTSSAHRERVEEFHLSRGRELLWTVTPIGMTLLVLIVVAAAAWIPNV